MVIPTVYSGSPGSGGDTYPYTRDLLVVVVIPIRILGDLLVVVVIPIRILGISW